ncbi:response regulator transcription factor [Clostridium sp. C8-1-8]|uniref:response regulator transcription factor n=1 Tax=Clostridium sp. C8-1-8 TaxID=2698831 RepID=UPI0013709A78|nr:response regulator transcription factor [Clostridium sp. C8-1-8]
MEITKILVIEDDSTISDMVRKALSKEGYSISCALDGEEGLRLWSQDDYKLIILDIMLPKLDGMEVMRRIRMESTVPIIVVSAKIEESDRVIGLGLGADDYLVKPFSLAELTARVKAQLRRYMYYSSSNTSSNNIQYGEICFDLDNYTVSKNGQCITLRAKEYELLKLFFEHPNKVFTKAQIFNSVWGEEYLGDDNTVMVHIRRLRNKIEDNPNEPKYIETVWGIGYRLGKLE